MKKILIADSNKASLVMTSEVFKEHYPGINIQVASSSQEALKIAKSKDFDAFIIDFELPDSTGDLTALKLKKISKTPVLITAFDNPTVTQAVQTHLSKFEDCKSILKKPLTKEVVLAVMERFCDDPTKSKLNPISCEVMAKVEMNISKLKFEFFVSIQDCTLTTMKFVPIKHSTDSIKIWRETIKQLNQIKVDQKIIFYFQNPSDIEFSKPFDSNHLPYMLEGQIIKVGSEKNGWFGCVEFNDHFLSKQIFESIVACLKPINFTKSSFF